MTKENLEWVQKLAVTTPYDAQDIANVFTLARSYGFAGQQAQGLTKDISDFAAGMGLGNQEIERIIVNFGQMQQQGKVTQRELNDLARGAFVPVNDVLKEMQENLGMTDKEFEKFRYTGEGVTAFLEAFSTIVKERFSGASEDMARTFKGATENAGDFIKSLFGFGIVTPILDTIGGKIADFLNALTEEGNWEAMTSAVEFFSTNLNSVFSELLGSGPDAQGIVDGIVQKLDEWGIWIQQHREDIIGFFEDAKEKVGEIWEALSSGDMVGLAEALGVNPEIIGRIKDIRDNIVSAFDTIKAWVDDNSDTIKKFFDTLGEIVGGVFEQITGQEIGGGGLDGFLESVTKFMQYVIDNQDVIAEWVIKILALWGAFQLFGFVLSIILPPLMTLAGIALGLIAIFTGLSAIFTVVSAVIGFLASPVGLVIVAIALLAGVVIYLANNWEWFTTTAQMLWAIFVFYIQTTAAQIWEFLVTMWQGIVETVHGAITSIVEKGYELGEGMRQAWDDMKNAVVEKGQELGEQARQKFDEIVDKIKSIGWVQVGLDIIAGIANGITQAAKDLAAAAVGAVTGALDAVRDILDMHSPSLVFMGLGENMMEGMAIGISKMSGLVTDSMAKAMGQVTMPAAMATAQVGGAVSTQNNYTNNYNLTVNSSSPTEPIVQDYNMLSSLAGG